MNLDIFNLEDPIEEPEVSIDDYVSKTKNLLNNILDKYHNSFVNIKLTEKQYKKCNCENCSSNEDCLINIDDKNYTVYSNEDGDCYIRKFDNDIFGEDIQDIINNENNFFYELLNYKIKK
jgi:hypothetical protein